MAIPERKRIKIPLLHLIYYKGGSVMPSEVVPILAKYFKLTQEDLQEKTSSGSEKFSNRVRWAREDLCKEGLLDRKEYGIWKITEKGIHELTKLGLINKTFDFGIQYNNSERYDFRNSNENDLWNNNSMVDLAIQEISKNGIKQFPEDFINIIDKCDEVELPDLQLKISPLSKTTILSVGQYFRYEAKNAFVAKYILYAHRNGKRRIKIPKDNLVIHKALSNHDKYCKEMEKKCLKFLIEKTKDEYLAKNLTKKSIRKT